jgi:hypothetical protein
MNQTEHSRTIQSIQHDAIYDWSLLFIISQLD